MTQNHTPDWADRTLTYRKLDYWVRRGWLHPQQPATGSGYHRVWPPAERWVANFMARVTSTGIPPQMAHDLARSSTGVLELARGLSLVYTPPTVFYTDAQPTPSHLLKEQPCVSSESTPVSPIPESPDPTASSDTSGSTG